MVLLNGGGWSAATGVWKFRSKDNISAYWSSTNYWTEPDGTLIDSNEPWQVFNWTNSSLTENLDNNPSTNIYDPNTKPLFYGKHIYIDNLPEGIDLSYNGEVQTFSLNGVYFVGTEFYSSKPAFTGILSWYGTGSAWYYKELFVGGDGKWYFQTRHTGGGDGDKTMFYSEGGEDYPWEVTNGIGMNIILNYNKNLVYGLHVI